MGNVPSHDTSPPSAAETHEGIPAPSGEANLIDTDYVIGQDNIKGQFVSPSTSTARSSPSPRWSR